MEHEGELLLPRRHERPLHTQRFLLTAASMLAVVGVAGALLGSWGGREQPATSLDLDLQQEFLVKPKEKEEPEKKDDSKPKHAAKGADAESTNVDVINHAETLQKKAMSLKGESAKLKDDAEHLHTKSQDLGKKVDETKAQASKETDNAEKDRNNAADLRRKAEELQKEAERKAKEMQKEAEKLIGKATDLDKDAKKKILSVETDKKTADALKQKAKKASSKADSTMKSATDAEEQAMQEIVSQRICIHLPGVRLQGNKPVSFAPIVGEHTNTDDWQCTDWCQKHTDCAQAVFIWETKTCELYGEATVEPLEFRERWPWYNSTYCGKIEEKGSMLDKLNQVYEKKPWVPPPHNCSWAGENCLNTGCCADVCKATWDFKTCKWYTCWKRDENWAGCELHGAPKNWDGKNLGGHPNGEVDPAPEGKLVQGVKLFCFSVVMWGQPAKEAWMSSEGEIAGHWKELGKGIMQCDDHAIIDGYEGGSVHNIASFVHAWKQVKEDGRWKQNDWSIKVDPDAVFFPDHFRNKVQYVWRTPQGSTVYLRNTKYKFQFLGAIEALTREALEVYMERGWECETHLTDAGGEDYWLLQCLEGLGINYQTDTSLLHDKYAADEACDDPNGVAHHFFKKIDDWDECWDTANEAWNNAHPQ